MKKKIAIKKATLSKKKIKYSLNVFIPGSQPTAGIEFFFFKYKV
jgi:hypothetical protein